MNERKQFITRRGRSAEYQRNEWLREMRRERKNDAAPFTVKVGAFWYREARTFRQAKIIALGTLCELNGGKRTNSNPNRNWDAIIIDNCTKIQIWESC